MGRVGPTTYMGRASLTIQTDWEAQLHRQVGRADDQGWPSGPDYQNGSGDPNKPNHPNRSGEFKVPYKPDSSDNPNELGGPDTTQVGSSR